MVVGSDVGDSQRGTGAGGAGTGQAADGDDARECEGGDEGREDSFEHAPLTSRQRRPVPVDSIGRPAPNFGRGEDANDR